MQGQLFTHFSRTDNNWFLNIFITFTEGTNPTKLLKHKDFEEKPRKIWHKWT